MAYDLTPEDKVRMTRNCCIAAAAEYSKPRDMSAEGVVGVATRFEAYVLGALAGTQGIPPSLAPQRGSEMNMNPMPDPPANPAPVDTGGSDAVLLRHLAQVTDWPPPSGKYDDHKFYLSLLAGYKKYGSLTPAQHKALRGLAGRYGWVDPEPSEFGEF